MHPSPTPNDSTPNPTPRASPALQQALQQRFQSQTKPPGSLGRLESLGEQLALIQGTLTPKLEAVRLCVFAASHGVAREGVSAYPPEVTVQMVANFLRGGAAVCVLARAAGASLHIIDCGVDGLTDPVLASAPSFFLRSQRAGTRSFLHEPAMTSSELEGALEAGREQVRLAIRDGIDALAVGEMGIGNTTSASALFAALLKLPPATVVGRGTGVDDAGVAHKQALIETALAKHALPEAQSDACRARHWLAAVGGYEIAAMTGAILEAGDQRLPIVVDGFIATAAALLAFEMNPGSREVCIFAHESGEAGHRAVLDKMRVTPLLSLGMRLGEGSGAALALPLLKAAARLVCEMATFENAGVSRSLQEKDNL